MMKRIKNYLHEVMDFYGANYLYPVSYTHLTLPTIRLV